MAFVNSYKKWPTVEVRAGKDVVKRSLHFPRRTVEELQALTKTTPDAITKLATWGTPAYLILDASQAQVGDRLDRKSVTGPKMLEDIEAQQKKLGAGVPVGAYGEFVTAVAGLAKDFVASVKSLDAMKGLTDAMRRYAEAKLDERIDGASPEDLGKWADGLPAGSVVERRIREKLK